MLNVLQSFILDYQDIYKLSNWFAGMTSQLQWTPAMHPYKTKLSL